MITQNSISSISDLRFKTKEVIAKAEKEPVFLFKNSSPQGVLMSFEKYQEMMDTLEDYYLSAKAEELEKQNKKNVKWVPHKKVKQTFND